MEVDVDDVIAMGDFELEYIIDSFVWLHVADCCKN